MRPKRNFYGVEVLRKYLVASILRTLLKIKLPKIIISAPRTGELMSYQAIQEYLRKLYDRYRESNKKEKGHLLMEAEHFTELSRKHLIRVLNGPKEVIEVKKRSGKPLVYGDELLPHIRTLWISMERISGKRMKAALSDWLPYYEADGFDKSTRLKLENMSPATLERFLRKLRGEVKANKGLVTTKSPSRFMKNKVPLANLDKKVDRPGHFQADTVGHCGTSTEGQYVNSLTLTDIESTWTENRAVFSKKGREIRAQLIDIQKLLPFKIISLNVDNGTEFLNGPVLEFVSITHQGQSAIDYTRSRAYKKNDNCYVEQKNFTHVRELFGYERFDSPELVTLMNDIYKTCWNPMLNFFIPTFKIKEKYRVGARIIKKYDTPKTPYQRLLESEHIANEKKQELREQKRKLNPFTLSHNLEKKLEIFFQEVRKYKLRKAS